MSESAMEKAIKNAEASVNMEGLCVFDYSKELCKKLLLNEITFDEYVKLNLIRVKSNAV